jgi:hypothetical protein
MATTAVPDGVILDVVVFGVDGSPSRERLGRIAAMLRDADLGAPRDRWRRRPWAPGAGVHGDRGRRPDHHVGCRVADEPGRTVVPMSGSGGRA